MIERGGGTIMNITSASGYADPTKPAGDGGWGLGYGMSKGAFHRIAGFLAVELGDQGIRCFNVQPGLIATERIAQDMAKFGIDERRRAARRDRRGRSRGCAPATKPTSSTARTSRRSTSATSAACSPTGPARAPRQQHPLRPLRRHPRRARNQARGGLTRNRRQQNQAMAGLLTPVRW